MKKMIAFILMLALLSTAAFAETVLPELDLQKYEFDVSEDTVIAGSGEPASEDTRTNKAGITRHFLNYDVRFQNLKWNLSYLFVDSQLKDVSAELDPEQVDPSLDPTELYNQACGLMNEILEKPSSVEGPTKIKEGDYKGASQYLSTYSKGKLTGYVNMIAKDNEILLLSIGYYPAE